MLSLSRLVPVSFGIPLAAAAAGSSPLAQCPAGQLDHIDASADAFGADVAVAGDLAVIGNPPTPRCTSRCSTGARGCTSTTA